MTKWKLKKIASHDVLLGRVSSIVFHIEADLTITPIPVTGNALEARHPPLEPTKRHVQDGRHTKRQPPMRCRCRTVSMPRPINA